MALKLALNYLWSRPDYVTPFRFCNRFGTAYRPIFVGMKEAGNVGLIYKLTTT